MSLGLAAAFHLAKHKHINLDIICKECYSHIFEKFGIFRVILKLIELCDEQLRCDIICACLKYR